MLSCFYKIVYMLMSSGKSMIQPFLEDHNDAKEIEYTGRTFTKLLTLVNFGVVVLFSSTFHHHFETSCNNGITYMGKIIKVKLHCLQLSQLSVQTIQNQKFHLRFFEGSDFQTLVCISLL